MYKTNHIPLSALFLDEKNPRHPRLTSQSEVIENLCRDEKIYELAKDIVDQQSINPLDLFGAIKHKSSTEDNATYVVLEGNRRLCALILLKDPQRAPPTLVDRFEKLADHWPPPKTLPVVVFSSRDAAKNWLLKLHAGEQNGAGRRSWRPEQQDRLLEGRGRNRLAVVLSDYADQENITVPSRSVTTANRFLSNPTFRNSLGIEESDDRFTTTLSKKEFDAALNRFYGDIGSRKITSRHNARDVNEYARNITNELDLISHGESTEIGKLSKPTVRKKTSPRPNFNKLKRNTDLSSLLNSLRNQKLIALYHSLTDISAADHSQILAVGLWSFLESLTALMGRSEDTSFVGFLNARKMKFGFSKSDQKNLSQILQRISSHGNTTKHHATLACFEHQQLINDFAFMEPLLARCLNELVTNEGL